MCNGKLFGDVSSGYGCGLKEFPGWRLRFLVFNLSPQRRFHSFIQGIYGRLSIAGEFIRQTCKCQT